jgi:AraC-like DNA-binding protein
MFKQTSHLPERFSLHRFLSQEPGVAVSLSTVELHFPLHWHEFYELEFILEGAGSHIFNGKVHPLHRGTAFLLTPADFHEMLAEPGTPLKIINIKFSEALLQEELREALFLQQTLRKADFSMEEMGLIEQDCNRLTIELGQSRAFSRVVIKGIVERLLADLFRKLAEPSPQSQEVHGGRQPEPESRHNETIQQALVFIQQHFQEPLSLDEVASHIHLSPKYFSQFFHSTTGISFVIYLQNIRLQFAASLLAGSRMSVTEVCYAAGFHSLSHFIRTFKNKFECSPTAYREQHKSSPDCHLT